jgi:hypothetical protein
MKTAPTIPSRYLEVGAIDVFLNDTGTISIRQTTDGGEVSIVVIDLERAERLVEAIRKAKAEGESEVAAGMLPGVVEEE